MRLQKTHFTTFKSSVDETTELNCLYLPNNSWIPPITMATVSMVLSCSSQEWVMHELIA